MTAWLKDINLIKNFNNWNSNSMHFRCFVRATNFVSLKHYPNFELRKISFNEREAYNKILSLINMNEIGSTLIIIDISPVEGLKAAYLLHKYQYVKPILTFNSPLHQFGFVGDEDYISHLLGYGEVMQEVVPKGFVFVLDKNRYNEYDDEQYKKFFNNQYDLTDEDLPPVEMIKELGYKKVLYINEGQLKEDIGNYLSYLRDSNCEVIIKNLGEDLDEKAK
jgi:hypothetical protein